jgi:hypothetical protein
MEQSKSLPSVVRLAFIIHLIVAVLIGLPLLFVPSVALGWFGYGTLPAGLGGPLRSLGAIILCFGGVTSLYGFLAKSWERVDYIVRGEIVYLAVQTLLYLVLGIVGKGPALGNWSFAVLSAALLALFGAAFMARPK